VAGARKIAGAVTAGLKEKRFCPYPASFLNSGEYAEWCDGVPDGVAPGPVATNEPTAWHGRVESCSKCGASLEGDPDRVPVQNRDGSVAWLCGKCGEGVAA